MNYWILTVTNQKSDGRTIPQQEIFNQRMRDEFWGLGARTPNRKSLGRGDRVVFYLGNPIKSFGATASLASESFELTAEEREKVSHGLDLYRTPFGVRLEEISVWDRPRRVEELVSSLDFIENKEFWGPYFQGGVRHLSEKDYFTIIGANSAPEQLKASVSSPSENQSEFALETHLEEFLDRNWQSIDFGCKLERYQVEDQTGRQFPIGSWSIDFLCLDRENGDFVVLELKRGKTSDATVGQILRYIAFVQENLAKPGQGVRGIIVARDADDALRYAIKPLQNVELRTYRVDFRLSAIAKASGMSNGQR